MGSFFNFPGPQNGILAASRFPLFHSNGHHLNQIKANGNRNRSPSGENPVPAGYCRSSQDSLAGGADNRGLTVHCRSNYSLNTDLVTAVEHKNKLRNMNTQSGEVGTDMWAHSTEMFRKDRAFVQQCVVRVYLSFVQSPERWPPPEPGVNSTLGCTHKYIEMQVPHAPSSRSVETAGAPPTIPVPSINFVFHVLIIIL